MFYKFNHHSISFRLLTGVLLVSSIIALIFTAMSLYWDYRYEVNRIDDNLKQVEILYLPSITQNLWNMNDETLQISLNALSNFGDIKYVYIEDVNKIAHKAGQTPTGSIREISYPVEYQRHGQKFFLGTLVVVASLDGVWTRLIERLVFVFTSSLLRTLILSFVILALFHQLATRHLIKISGYLNQLGIKDGRDLEVLELDRKGLVSDELDMVVSSVNNMHDQLKKHRHRRQMAEMQLRTLNSHLEKEVKRQIKENQKQQMAIESSARLSSLGEMAGGIAHEINNPLSILVGYSAMLRKLLGIGEIDQKKIRHITTRIEKTVERISTIIQGLLRLSRDTSQDIFLSSCLNTIVQDALAISRERLKSKGLRIKVKMPDSKVYALCHPAEIGQILINLLNNSFYEVKDRDAPWVEIKLSTLTNGDAQISVTDSGLGIPPEIHNDLLKPFFTTKPPGSGTGLGLSISRAIADNHNGRLYLDDTSKFTRFVLELPATRNLYPPDPIRHQAHAKKTVQIDG